MDLQEDKEKRETPPVGSVCRVHGAKIKSPDQVGHEVSFTFSAANLPKFDWNTKSDPMVALFERVRISGSSPKVLVEEEPWSCSICTYMNPPLFMLCEMCNSQRPASSLVGEFNLSAR